MKILYSILILSCFTVACNKYSDMNSDADSTYFIRGRLFIQDSVNDNGAIKPLSSKATGITISYKNDLTRVIYTTDSDDNGYFTFTNLKKNAAYNIYAQKTTGQGNFTTLFSDTADVILDTSKNGVTLLLQVDTLKQNGLLFSIRDNATRGLIRDCDVCIFSSQQLFLTDNCAYANYSGKSNANGKFIQTNIPAGRYYVRFRKVDANNVLLLSATAIVDIHNTGMTIKDILLI